MNHFIALGTSVTGKVAGVSAGSTAYHACTVCKERHPHTGEVMVKRWCTKCSGISVYKSIGGVLHGAGQVRNMITVVV